MSEQNSPNQLNNNLGGEKREENEQNEKKTEKKRIVSVVSRILCKLLEQEK